MALYSIQQYTGIIIGIKNRGEAHRALHLLTQDGRLLFVYAQSSRQSKKVSPNTQWLQCGTFDVVVGNSLRLIGATIDSVSMVSNNVTQMRYCALICRYLLRFVAGEDSSPQIFSITRTHIIESEQLAPATILAQYTLFRYQLLCTLGYGEYDPLLSSDQQRERVQEMEYSSQL